MKTKKIFCVFGICILIFLALGACITSGGLTYEEAFKRNWDIDLPENMTQQLNESDSDRFGGGGDGIRYAVYSAIEEPAAFIEDFNKERDEEFENTVTKTIDAAQFDVPENFLPDWEAEYYWKHTGKGTSEIRKYWHNLYIIYFPDTLTFVFCQYFM